MRSSAPPPRWLLIGSIGTAASVWVLVVLVIALAWMWRATDPPWVLPALLATACILAGALVTVGRKPFIHAVGVLYTRPRLQAMTALFIAWIGLLVIPQHPPPEAPSPEKHVAIVGAGAAGVHAAWMLERMGVDVTIYEATTYIGGHAYTHPFQTSDGEVFPVDMGFVFGAPYSYQEMKALMAVYDVGRTPSSLAISGEVDGHLWATGMDHLDAEAQRFQHLAEASFDNPRLNLVPFGLWLRFHGFDTDFRRKFLSPILSVLFITDVGVYDYSTRFVLNMLGGPRQWVDFENNAPAWVVEGGSSLYYRRLLAHLGSEIRLATPVTEVQRVQGGVQITAMSQAGTTIQTYDDVILAVPAYVARTLLADRTWFESFTLSQVRYEGMEVLVHTDTSRLPNEPLLRSYNYFVDNDRFGDEFELTALAAHTSARTVDPEPLVTLSPLRAYEDIRARMTWQHHTQDLWHLAVVTQLMPTLQGRGGIWYAGDWVTFIGHGPAMRTGLRASCEIAGTTSAHTGSTTPCVDVQLVDPSPANGLKGTHETVCGEEGAFELLVELACHRSILGGPE